jgi:hypothetical protein
MMTVHCEGVDTSCDGVFGGNAQQIVDIRNALQLVPARARVRGTRAICALKTEAKT